MPRIADGRPPAEPHSADQRARRSRIIKAAAKLGAEHGSDRMQMMDVAKEAGVAIATLYRYFPSKADLFVGVLQSQVEHMKADAPVAVAPGTRAGAVADVLIAASRELFEHPRLAIAMIQANNAAQGTMGATSSTVTNLFGGTLTQVIGIDDPDAHDRRMVRLVEQTFYGILITVLNGHITAAECEDDIREACRLLIGPNYD